ncbi:MAG TPA: UDP-N-acetyl glucosamine 2-epimerase [Gemmatimonadaceae bacterium]|nr:UDP-N-acetyl glucosamine 2-epimerase [Gemmatimonadaceae bacterium]
MIKLSRVISELDRHTRHVLVHSGQNHDYELNGIFFHDLEIRKPDHFLAAAGESAAETIGNVISHFDKVLAKERPDALVLLGDTNSCLGAIAAKRRRVPIFHLEAGNRCFDDRVPEEINRRIVDHISDINLVYTEHARRYLIAEGIRPDTIIKTGSPMREVLLYYGDRIAASHALSTFGLAGDEYFLVSAHREENVDDASRLTSLLETLDALAETFSKRVLVSTHPRTRARLDSFGLSAGQNVEFMKPLGFFDYAHLQKNAFCVISDSGTLTEEASLLGFPAVMVRESHERPEGMDEGTLVTAGLDKERAIEAVRLVKSQPMKVTRTPVEYMVDNVSIKVIRVLMSYVDFVRRTVWAE